MLIDNNILITLSAFFELGEAGPFATRVILTFISLRNEDDVRQETLFVELIMSRLSVRALRHDE